MRTRARSLLAATAVAVLLAVLVVGRASAGPTVLTATLSGDSEVGTEGDPNGTGTASVTLDSSAGTACFELDWAGIRGPWAAHIHEGAADVAGPVVVTFFQTRDSFPLPRTIKGVSGCAKNVDAALIDAIVADPGGYYVNVHNNRFPAGAIRGQLQ